MKHAFIHKEILRLALPSILANITVPLVGMVDIAVAGHLSGVGGMSAAAYIGGVTIGTLLFDLLYWNFGFLRISTGGLTAQAFGRNDKDECANLLIQSVAIALFFSIVVLAIQWPFQHYALMAVKPTEDVCSLAVNYFFIRIWAAPATLTLMALRGWFVGMQDTMSSMLTDLTVNAINIVASIVLTLGIGKWHGFGFNGIAIGTVIAQYSGLLLAISIILIKYRRLPFHLNRPERGKLHALMTMNGDLFIRSLCFIAIYVGFTTIAARYGNVFLSVSSILMKLLMIFSYFTDGFAYSGEAMTGRFIGERNKPMLRLTVTRVFGWSMGVALLFIIIYGLTGDIMLGIMTSDEEVFNASLPFMWWLLLMPPLGCAAFTWDGIYAGATASKAIRNAMIVATLGFFAFYFAGVWCFGIDSMSDGTTMDSPAMNLLMLAYFVHLLARTLYLTLRYKRDVAARIPN
ncbi:MAG: MATE family efflux transporter [Prevotellaceae bacterium]|nr:MATE family efflux transporter [Prevotellaceae bacterium]